MGFYPIYSVDSMLLTSGNSFECHEEFLCSAGKKPDMMDDDGPGSPSRDADNRMSSRLSRPVETRRRY